MTKFISLFAVAMLAAFVLAAPASAQQITVNVKDASFDAMSQSGNHSFYVWCTAGKRNYTKNMQGANAKAAQTKLAKTLPKTCWPLWKHLNTTREMTEQQFRRNNYENNPRFEKSGG